MAPNPSGRISLDQPIRVRLENNPFSRQKAPEYEVPRELRVQRRLLLTFSFALLAVYGLSIQLSTTATIQGLVMNFKRPWIVTGALWVCWAWSLWRFWQQVRVFSLNPYNYARNAAYLAIASERVREAIQAGVDAGDYAGRGLQPGTKITTRIEDINPAGLLDQAAPSVAFLNVRVRYGGPDNEENEMHGGANCTLAGEALRGIQRRAELRLKAANPYFADIRVPYLIAGLVGLLGFFRLGCAFGQWFW